MRSSRRVVKTLLTCARGLGSAVGGLDPQALADLDEKVTSRVGRLWGPVATTRALVSEATLEHGAPSLGGPARSKERREVQSIDSVRRRDQDHAGAGVPPDNLQPYRRTPR